METRALVGPFTKSSYSGAQGECLETAPLADGGKAVRDSKIPTGPVLRFTPTAWTTFVAHLRA